MTTATDLFEDVMEWLREHYSEYRFFTERDVVWTVQMEIGRVIRAEGLPYHVFNDYRVAPRVRADLVITDPNARIEVAAEFKYEPSHNRKVRLGGDIMDGKFPVVFWNDPSGSVGKDVVRVRDFVRNGWAQSGYSVFVDEGSYFSWREPFEGAKWLDWGGGVSVLWSSLGT